MLTNQFKIVIGLLIYIATIGGLLVNQINLKSEIRELQARPVAIMPTKEIMAPTATPEATLIPTRLPVKIVVPTK